MKIFCKVFKTNLISRVCLRGLLFRLMGNILNINPVFMFASKSFTMAYHGTMVGTFCT